MEYEIQFSTAATRQISDVQHTLISRIDQAISKLGFDPYPSGAVAIQAGKASAHRLRVGEWRIIYRVDSSARIIEIDAVLPRSKAYR